MPKLLAGIRQADRMEINVNVIEPVVVWRILQTCVWNIVRVAVQTIPFCNSLVKFLPSERYVGRASKLDVGQCSKH